MNKAKPFTLVRTLDRCAFLTQNCLKILKQMESNTYQNKKIKYNSVLFHNE